MKSSPPPGRRRLDQEQDQIDIGAGGERLIDHILVQAAPGLVDARSVEKKDLTAGKVLDSQNPVAGGLGLGGGDGDLLPQHPVEQGGFPDVRPSDDGNEAGAETVGRFEFLVSFVRYCSFNRQPYPIDRTRFRSCQMITDKVGMAEMEKLPKRSAGRRGCPDHGRGHRREVGRMATPA